jgi:hypothetical protein
MTTTATLDKPTTTVSKSPKQARGATSPAPKAQLPKKVAAAAEAFAKDVAGKVPAKTAVKKPEKAVAPKAKPERKVSAMQVIRRTLAHNHNATVEEISKACTDAGVPKAYGTIATIRSDFMQTYAALLEANRIKD